MCLGLRLDGIRQRSCVILRLAIAAAQLLDHARRHDARLGRFEGEVGGGGGGVAHDSALRLARNSTSSSAYCCLSSIPRSRSATASQSSIAAWATVRLPVTSRIPQAGWTI